MLRQWTLRGLDARAEREIRELAKRERISLTKAAARLLEKGAGVSERSDDRIGTSLDRWIGTWTDAQAREFLDSVASLEAIDTSLWR